MKSFGLLLCVCLVEIEFRSAGTSATLARMETEVGFGPRTLLLGLGPLLLRLLLVLLWSLSVLLLRLLLVLLVLLLLAWWRRQWVITGRHLGWRRGSKFKDPIDMEKWSGKVGVGV